MQLFGELVFDVYTADKNFVLKKIEMKNLINKHLKISNYWITLCVEL